MDMQKRGNIIARQKKMMRIVFAWAISSSIALVVMSLLCGYAFLSRPIKLVPMTGREMSISDMAYSPEYLVESAKKIAQLRFTFNVDTIKQQYAELVNITQIKYQDPLKEKLKQEISVVNHKEITSVFYIKNIKVDLPNNSAVVTGELDRSSHGVPLKSEIKSYKIQFAFKGTLALESIKEVKNA